MRLADVRVQESADVSRAVILRAMLETQGRLERDEDGTYRAHLEKKLAEQARAAAEIRKKEGLTPKKPEAEKTTEDLAVDKVTVEAE